MLQPRQLAGRSLVLYLPDLSGGGTERLLVGLAPAFLEAGLTVTFLLDRQRGMLLETVPDGVGIVELGAHRQIAAIPRLVRYLRKAEPDLLLTSMEHASVVAVGAQALAGVRTRIVVSQHNALSKQAAQRGVKYAILPSLFRLALPRAAAIVAVSEGVADDLAERARLPRRKVEVIYNGAIRPDFDRVLGQPLDVEWPETGPVVLAVGRLVPQKDHATLLRAVALLAQTRSIQLVILGEGPLRADLEALSHELGIAERVRLPGFAPNPLPAMSRADVVALSSKFEGFGLVLAESLACGTPVVSTDCPYGPAEILGNGEFGTLVPVGEPAALAAALEATLDTPHDRAALTAQGRSFSVERCAASYLELFERILTP